MKVLLKHSEPVCLYVLMLLLIMEVSHISGMGNLWDRGDYIRLMRTIHGPPIISKLMITIFADLMGIITNLEHHSSAVSCRWDSNHVLWARHEFANEAESSLSMVKFRMQISLGLSRKLWKRCTSSVNGMWGFLPPSCHLSEKRYYLVRNWKIYLYFQAWW